MTAQEFLMQYRDMHDYAEEKREKYLIARSKAESIPSSLANAGEVRAYNNHRAEDMLLKLTEAREAYVDAAYDAALTRSDIAWFISFIPGTEGIVLYERYIQQKTWKQIADEYHKAPSGLYKAHLRALDIVQNLLDNGTDSKSVYWDPIMVDFKKAK